MFAPGVAEVMDEFHVTDVQLGSFVVSVYLLGYAFGPLILAPLSVLSSTILATFCLSS